MRLEKINGKTRRSFGDRITPMYSCEGHIIEMLEMAGNGVRSWICEDLRIVAFTMNELVEKLSRKLGK